MKLAVILLSTLVFFTSLAAEPIKVGIALRTTPELNSFADSLIQGIEFAKLAFEKKNPDVKFELVKYSHKSGHDSVDEAAQRIIKDKVRFVLGGEMSDEAFALSENFQGKKILLITPTASNPLLTAGKPYVFRTCFSDGQVAKQLAKYVNDLNGIHSIGVIHNTSNAYSDHVTTSFLEKLIDLKNKTPITEFRYASEQPDFKSAVERFKAAKVDLVVAFTLQESLKAFHQLATRAGMNPLYIGSDGWGTNESILKAIPNFKGVRNAYWHEESKFPASVEFKTDFAQKYATKPNAWDAAGYDAAYVLFEAIAKAKQHDDVDEVTEILRTNTFKNTVTSSSVKFNLRNTLVKPLYLYEMNQGEVKFVKEIADETK